MRITLEALRLLEEDKRQYRRKGNAWSGLKLSTRITLAFAEAYALYAEGEGHKWRTCPCDACFMSHELLHRVFRDPFDGFPNYVAGSGSNDDAISEDDRADFPDHYSDTEFNELETGATVSSDSSNGGNFGVERTDFTFTPNRDHGDTGFEVAQGKATHESDLSYTDFFREQDYVSEWEAYEASRM